MKQRKETAQIGFVDFHHASLALNHTQNVKDEPPSHYVDLVRMRYVNVWIAVVINWLANNCLNWFNYQFSCANTREKCCLLHGICQSVDKVVETTIESGVGYFGCF